MRSRPAIAAFLLLASLLMWGEVVPSTAVAGGNSLPCTDPRGCPDLSVDAGGLNSAHLERSTFEATDCAVVEGMTEAGTRDLLVFPYITPNHGPGALIVGNPADHRKLFDFTTCHGHAHFKDYADYRLWTPAGYAAWQNLRAANPDALAADILKAHPELRSELVEGAKRGFCLLDYKPARQFSGTRDPRTFTSCGSNQGVGVGWQDEYTSRLDGQWIDVTDVPPGTYVLDVEANAERVFVEQSYLNNSASATVEVRHRTR